MTVHDWRSLPSEALAEVFDAEVMRWSRALHWDTRSNWIQVDAARRAGRLPGLIVRDARGQIGGWGFYLLHDAELQIGALTSTSEAMTAALLDGVLASPEAARASSVVLFAYADAPALMQQLGVRGFAVERYLYLSARLEALGARLEPTDDARPERVDGRPVCVATPYEHAVHLAGVASLLASAYPSHDPARPFVRSGQPREWADYVTQLVTTAGCGAFLPDASFVAPGASTVRAEGATLVTRLAADTVHLAQIAIAPEAQGRGLARRLLSASLEAARAKGFTYATLLVSEGNARARQFYARSGFGEAASFVSAARG